MTSYRVRLCSRPPPDDLDPTRDESITSGADGRYELSRLRAGSWSLLASAPGRLPARIPTVPVGDGKVTDDMHLVLGPGESLAGRVVGSLKDGVGSSAEVTVPPGIPEFRRDIDIPEAEVAPFLEPVE